MESKPPVEMVTTTKSAPSRDRRWSVVVDTVVPAPRAPSRVRARASVKSQRSATSWSPSKKRTVDGLVGLRITRLGCSSR